MHWSELWRTSQPCESNTPEQLPSPRGISSLTSSSSVSSAMLMHPTVSHRHEHTSTSGISSSPAKRFVHMGGLSFGEMTLLFVLLLHLSYGKHRAGNTSEGA